MDEWVHPEIEYVWKDGPTPGTSKGLSEMAASTRNFMSAWQRGFRIVAEDIRELDTERVFAMHAFHGRGKASGLDIGDAGAKGAILFHIQGGRVTRELLYMDRDRALADLGLASEGGSA
jgi:hypothetical protein